MTLSADVTFSDFDIPIDDTFTDPFSYTCGFDKTSKQFKFCCQGPPEGGEYVTTEKVNH